MGDAELRHGTARWDLVFDMIKKFSQGTKKQIHLQPKWGYLMIVAMLLQACQSVDTQAPQPSQSQLPFADNANTPAVRAKTDVLAAISKHLGKERYALSTYHYRVFPYNTNAQIDGNADSLWTTMLKLKEYQKNKAAAEYQQDAYRGMAEYLVEDDSLPYLRYYDEKNNTVPVNVISREIAMSDDYQQRSQKIQETYNSLKSCLSEASANIDEKIKIKPTSTSQDSSIKEQLDEIASCIKTSDESLSDLAKTAEGYQRQDIETIRQCASNYQTDLQQILSAKRQNKSLSAKNYAVYDNVWRNYTMCRTAYTTSSRQDAFSYIENGLSQKKLDTMAAIKPCLDEHKQTQEQLKRDGITPATDPKAYNAAYYQALYCSANAVNEYYPFDKPITLPDDYEQSLSLEHDFYDKVFGEGAEYDRPSLLQSYKQMKTADNSERGKTDGAEPELDNQLPLPTGIGGNIYANMFSSMLDYIKKSPEQLTAKNLYQYDNTTITILSHYKPKERQISSVLGLEYRSTTAEQSLQLPVMLDFNQAQITADSSALLPLLALAAPKYAYLPEEIAEGKMRFYLPQPLAEMIPTQVVFDAVMRAYPLALAQLDSERFTPVAMSGDDYAKQIGAAQVIKFSPNIAEQGKMLAIIAKLVANDLKNYIDANADSYQDANKKLLAQSGLKVTPASIKSAIDDWVLVNQGYQSDDVGSFLSLVEAILPFNNSSHLYYYLNGQGELIGMQSIQNNNQQMTNVAMQIVGRTRLSDKPFDHAYTTKLPKTSNAVSVDGNQWLWQIWQDEQIGKLAIQAREDYRQDGDTDTQSDDACDDTCQNTEQNSSELSQ